MFFKGCRLWIKTTCRMRLQEKKNIKLISACLDVRREISLDYLTSGALIMYQQLQMKPQLASLNWTDVIKLWILLCLPSPALFCWHFITWQTLGYFLSTVRKMKPHLADRAVGQVSSPQTWWCNVILHPKQRFVVYLQHQHSSRIPR